MHTKTLELWLTVDRLHITQRDVPKPNSEQATELREKVEIGLFETEVWVTEHAARASSLDFFQGSIAVMIFLPDSSHFV